MSDEMVQRIANRLMHWEDIDLNAEPDWEHHLMMRRARKLVAEVIEPEMLRARAEGAREALTGLAREATLTAESVGADGNWEWEKDERYVAASALNYLNAHHPEEEK